MGNSKSCVLFRKNLAANIFIVGLGSENIGDFIGIAQADLPQTGFAKYN
jgi:hypothetical protein